MFIFLNVTCNYVKAEVEQDKRALSALICQKLLSFLKNFLRSLRILNQLRL